MLHAFAAKGAFCNSLVKQNRLAGLWWIHLLLKFLRTLGFSCTWDLEPQSIACRKGVDNESPEIALIGWLGKTVEIILTIC